MANSWERDVFDKLKLKLETLSWINHVEFEQVRLAISDWTEDKLPVIQFWWDLETFIPQKPLLDTTLTIVLELIMRSTATEEFTQVDLLDRLRDIRELLGADPSLDISGQMVHILPVQVTRDFTIQPPFMVADMQLSVRGIVPYGGC